MELDCQMVKRHVPRPKPVPADRPGGCAPVVTGLTSTGVLVERQIVWCMSCGCSCVCVCGCVCMSSCVIGCVPPPRLGGHNVQSPRPTIGDIVSGSSPDIGCLRRNGAMAGRTNCHASLPARGADGLVEDGAGRKSLVGRGRLMD